MGASISQPRWTCGRSAAGGNGVATRSLVSGAVPCGANGAAPGTRRSAAFSLVELLVVIVVIGVLASLLLPALARSKEKAKVVRVHAELQAVGLALEMYSTDNEGRFPPVRVNCNSDLASHWCEFPTELASAGFLPWSERPGMAACMEDIFNPGHTYKYAAPGPSLLNGGDGGNYQLWTPDELPGCTGETGKYFSDPQQAPLRWAIWSLGPRPNDPRSQDTRAPVAARSWYRRTGDGGIIGRFALKDGTQFKTP